MSADTKGKLSVGALIPTYKRPDMAAIAVHHLLTQDRPIEQVVIVRAETDDSMTEQGFHDRLGDALKETRFVFVEAPAGITPQRNRGLKELDTDLVLVLDDDVLAPPTFASTLAGVLEEDPDEILGGVAGQIREGPAARAHAAKVAIELGFENQAPAESLGPTGPKDGPKERLKSRLREAKGHARQAYWTRAVSYIGPFFPDSDMTPIRPLPPHLRRPELEETVWLPGGVTMYRTKVLQAAGYCELFNRYAPTEDIEASYRISREKLLLRHKTAWAWHAHAIGGRWNNEKLVFTTLLNLSYIARTTMPQRPALTEHMLSHHRRMTQAYSAMDIVRGRGFSTVRAGKLGLAASERLFAAPDDRVDAVYLELVDEAEARGFQ